MKKQPLKVEYETWKAIPGFDDRYLISTYGRVLSLVGKSKHLKQHLRNGYPFVKLVCPFTGKCFNRYIHRLVLLTFLGENKLTVNHKDGNKFNNRFSNLEYMTIGDNYRHALRTGLQKVNGSANGNSKLTEEQVKKILKDKRKARLIASDYGVSTTLIYMIRKGMVWQTVKL